MKQAVLITTHYWNSKRKAGFHWIADSLARSGWDVLFFTAPISWLSALRNDYRMEYPVRKEAGKIVAFENNIKSFVWFTPWHPANLRLGLLNKISHNFFRKYAEFPLGESEEYIKQANLIVIECGPALLLVNRLKKLNPDARIVYRVSDDLRLLHNHPLVIESEEEAAPKFDLVSVPSNFIYKRFEGLKNLRLQYHGIRKDLYDENRPSPYDDIKGTNFVFVGQAHFDIDFLMRASEMSPDWHFHIIGPIKDIPKRDNIHTYGEMPFRDTVPYIKHANIGLHTLAYSFGAESFTDSLKVIQFTYCSLPIVAPEFLKGNREHAFYYRPGDDNSIREAINNALNCNRSQIINDDILSWDEITPSLTGEQD